MRGSSLVYKLVNRFANIYCHILINLFLKVTKNAVRDEDLEKWLNLGVVTGIKNSQHFIL